FFQLSLVGGYLLIHLASRRPGTRIGASVYLVTLTLGAATLYAGAPQLHLAQLDGAGSGLGPVLLDLIGALGVAATALAMSTPLWSRSYLAQRLGDPYPLFAASNAGSLAALVIYPLL